MHSREQRDRSTRDDENRVKARHRIAGSAGGTSRSSGSLFDDALDALVVDVPIQLGDARSLTEAAREHRTATERALELEQAALEYGDAVHAADVTAVASCASKTHSVDGRNAAPGRTQGDAAGR